MGDLLYNLWEYQCQWKCCVEVGHLDWEPLQL